MSINPNQLSIPFTTADADLLATVTSGAEPNPVIASQAVAIAGVDNSQMMTALRVNEAIINIVGMDGGGEINVGANVGSGVGVYDNKVGVVLNFKSLVAGTGVTIVDNGTSITFNVSTGGLTSTDQLPEGVTNLYFTNARVASAPAVVANTAKISATGSINTHSDVDYMSPTNGQVLTWNTSISKWTNEDATGGGGSGAQLTNIYINQSGSSIPALTLVAQDPSGNLIMIDPSNYAQVSEIIGVTNTLIPTTSSGTVTLSGIIPNITTSFNIDDVLYLNTNGTLTTTVPDIGNGSFVAGYYIVQVGKITVNTNNPSNKDLLVSINVVGQI